MLIFIYWCPLNVGRLNNNALAKQNVEFVACMEDVLDIHILHTTLRLSTWLEI